MSFSGVNIGFLFFSSVGTAEHTVERVKTIKNQRKQKKNLKQIEENPRRSNKKAYNILVVFLISHHFLNVLGRFGEVSGRFFGRLFEVWGRFLEERTTKSNGNTYNIIIFIICGIISFPCFLFISFVICGDGRMQGMA